jgi:hypothetical protein
MELKFVDEIKLATELPDYRTLQLSKTIKDDEGTTLLLSQGIGHFHDRNFMDSAKWFLLAWRQFSEYLLECQYARFPASNKSYYRSAIFWDINTLRIYQKICIYSLHDAAIAFFLSSGEYQVSTSITCDSKWPKTAEEVKINGKPIRCGNSVKDLITIIDLFGELLGEAKTAKDAANIIAHVCMLQIVSAGYCQITGDKSGMDMIESNLAWIIAHTTRENKWVEKAAADTLDKAWIQSHRNESQRSKWIRHSYDTAKTNLEEFKLLSG